MRCRGPFTIRIAIHEGDVTAVGQPSQFVGRRHQAAIAMRDPHRDHRAGRQPAQGRDAPWFDRQPHVNVPAKIAAAIRVGRERRRGPANRTGTGNQTRFEQDLSTVADPEHEFAGLRRFDDRIGHFIMRGDRAGADAILVREATWQNERIERAQGRSAAAPVHGLSVDSGGV